MPDTPHAAAPRGFDVDDILARILYSTGLKTQTELAEKLGVRRAAITDAKRRKTIPSEWFLKLCRMYNLSPLWLESGLGPMHLAGESSETPPMSAPGGLGLPTSGKAEPVYMDEFAFIPKVKAVPRMGPEGLETDDEVDGYYAFRQDWLRRKGRIAEMRIMRVAGDSMEPTLRDGDAVLIDQSQTDVVYGKIYVVGIDDGVVVKRLDKRPGKLVLVSDNRQDYPPVEIELNEAVSVRIVGRVIWMAREIF